MIVVLEYVGLILYGYDVQFIGDVVCQCDIVGYGLNWLDQGFVVVNIEVGKFKEVVKYVIEFGCGEDEFVVFICYGVMIQQIIYIVIFGELLQIVKIVCLGDVELVYVVIGKVVEVFECEQFDWYEFKLLFGWNIFILCICDYFVILFL